MSDLLLLAQADPTGFGSPVGRIVVLLALLASLVTLVRVWVRHRGR